MGTGEFNAGGLPFDGLAVVKFPMSGKLQMLFRFTRKKPKTK